VFYHSRPPPPSHPSPCCPLQSIPSYSHSPPDPHLPSPPLLPHCLLPLDIRMTGKVSRKRLKSTQPEESKSKPPRSPRRPAAIKRLRAEPEDGFPMSITTTKSELTRALVINYTNGFQREDTSCLMNLLREWFITEPLTVHFQLGTIRRCNETNEQYVQPLPMLCVSDLSELLPSGDSQQLFFEGNLRRDGCGWDRTEIINWIQTQYRAIPHYRQVHGHKEKHDIMIEHRYQPPNDSSSYSFIRAEGVPLRDRHSLELINGKRIVHRRVDILKTVYVYNPYGDIRRVGDCKRDYDLQFNLIRVKSNEMPSNVKSLPLRVAIQSTSGEYPTGDILYHTRQSDQFIYDDQHDKWQNIRKDVCEIGGKLQNSWKHCWWTDYNQSKKEGNMTELVKRLTDLTLGLALNIGLPAMRARDERDEEEIV
jgi:hypothetical protein